jgi:hypothetical protein
MKTLLPRYKRIIQVGLLILIGVAISAAAGLFGRSKGWKEEVQLLDGSVIVVERVFKLGGYRGLESRDRAELDQTLSFKLPGSNQPITWTTQYRDDTPDPNSLSPLLLNVVQGVPYLATSPAGCIAYNKWGRPNPPYILFKHVNGAWQRIALAEFPAVLVHPNLFPGTDSERLKAYYTKEETKAEWAEGNRSVESKAILRDALKQHPESITSCGELIYNGNGGWIGVGWFTKQPNVEACLKYCELEKMPAQFCPCNTIFKGK